MSKKKTEKQKKNERLIVGLLLLTGGAIVARQQGWFGGSGIPVLDPQQQTAGFGFGNIFDIFGGGNGGNGTVAETEFLSPREKYYYDIRFEKPGDALEIYRRNWFNNHNDLKTRFPNIADFWAWLWNQQTFNAYVSYNQKQQWLPDERVILIQ